MQTISPVTVISNPSPPRAVEHERGHDAETVSIARGAAAPLPPAPSKMGFIREHAQLNRRTYEAPNYSGINLVPMMCRWKKELAAVVDVGQCRKTLAEIRELQHQEDILADAFFVEALDAARRVFDETPSARNRDALEKLHERYADRRGRDSLAGSYKSAWQRLEAEKFVPPARKMVTRLLELLAAELDRIETADRENSALVGVAYNPAPLTFFGRLGLSDWQQNLRDGHPCDEVMRRFLEVADATA